MDFDTGKKTLAAEYTLTDDAYAKLLDKLSERKFDQTSPALRANILGFYSDLSAPIETKKDNVRWQSVLISLAQLKALTPVPSLVSSPAQPAASSLVSTPVSIPGRISIVNLIIVLKQRPA